MDVQSPSVPAESRENLYFRTVKEDRGVYFVEYKPPSPSFRFATLGITFPEPVEVSAVVKAMEAEALRWISRYPIPVMVSSFGGSGDLIELMPERSCDHLIVFLESGEPQLCWELVKDEGLPEDALSPDRLKEVYRDIPFKTQEQLRVEARKMAKSQRLGWLIVVGWIAVIPGVWAVVEWAGPNWLGTAVMLYGVWNAVKKTLKLLGKWRKTPEEIKGDQRETTNAPLLLPLREKSRRFHVFEGREFRT